MRLDITRRSPLTGRRQTRTLAISNLQLLRWGDAGGAAQALPAQLSADERLFLATGITAEEWQHYVSGPDPLGGEG